MKPLHRLGATALLAAACGLAQAAPPLVVLVRHAEKAEEPADDPGLSVAGQARAQALGAALGFADIGAVVTTPYRRARETAQAVAARVGVVPVVVAAQPGEDLAAHVAAVAAVVRQQARPVLVVGHGNTVPALVAALGGPALPDLCETSFGHLFVVAPELAKVPVLMLRYGAADPSPAAGCL